MRQSALNRMLRAPGISLRLIFNVIAARSGAVDDRKITSSRIVELKQPTGGMQKYRRISLSFSPLTYNQVQLLHQPHPFVGVAFIPHAAHLVLATTSTLRPASDALHPLIYSCISSTNLAFCAQNLVERKALISATAVGGTAFIFVSSCMANRYKTVEGTLREVQESFRATGSNRRA